ncbi:hypothetical protein D1BOALGB6SA_10472 [Olavius sp. associated proteobacterium Delta 1]|nr:hypothetical protein D1BOALGB6SA_10472 [Olavius sp. associated proteobacterium Delta 1]
MKILWAHFAAFEIIYSCLAHPVKPARHCCYPATVFESRRARVLLQLIEIPFNKSI